MPERKILVTRPSMPSLAEYVEEIASLWESRWLTNVGEEHERFRRGLGAYLGVGDSVELLANGHLGLECMLSALGLGFDGRDEVITTPYTFASTVNAAVRCGLRPVFVDVRPSDLTVDPGCVERAVTDRTCAILGVHVYGNPCDDEALRAIADRYGLILAYDAAHAFGVTLGSRSVASLGDASMFSLHATKVFHCVEGGVVTFHDPAVGESIRTLRNFGIEPVTGEVTTVGGNAKLDEFRAAMGVVNLRHVNAWIADRARVEERYRERLSGVPGIRLIGHADGVSSNHIYMPVFFDSAEFGSTRDDVMGALDAACVGARRYFYPLVSDFPCYRGIFDSGDTPVARSAAERVLTLPMYEGLEDSDVDRICDIVLGCAR